MTRSPRDYWREHDNRLTVNGYTLPSYGRCACGCKLYSASERSNGQCVDCQRSK